MEEIIAMQRKNSPNSPTKIKELLHQVSNIHFQSDKITSKLEGKLYLYTWSTYKLFLLFICKYF